MGLEIGTVNTDALETIGDADEIFRRYGPRILALARKHVDRSMRGKFDPDDVLQSVCASFFTSLDQGRIDVGNEESLWGLLATITVRKCINRRLHFRAERRNVTREVPLDYSHAQRDVAVLASDPTPSSSARVGELVAHMTDKLSDRDRQIIQMSLDGHTIREISSATGRAERTVRRVLASARQRLSYVVD